MARENQLLRDSEGYVRFLDPVKATSAQAKEIIETVYVQTQENLAFKQLDITFDEYDKRRGMKGPRGASRRWTDEEERYVLLHHEDGDDAVGAELGRTPMSIYMHKSALLSEFDEWLRSPEGKQYKDVSREEQVDAFIRGD